MRNGVLGVLGEMLSQVLRPDKMDSEQMKSIRDQCLDRLEVCVCLSFFVSTCAVYVHVSMLA